MPTVIKTLHVEDDPLQRMVIAHHLTAMPEFTFDITSAATEDEALTVFATGGLDLAILDYQLAQGNGLDCIRRIRASDPALPVIAVSGVATPETAAELVRAGADDYLSKEELSGQILARRVRHALARATVLRSRASKNRAAESLCRRICDAYLNTVAAGLLPLLDEFEQTARATKLTTADALALFEAAADHAGAPTARHLRPLLLDVMLRLSHDRTGGADAWNYPT